MSRQENLADVQEEGEVELGVPQPLILQPQTPNEPIEFLSRSWSLSAEELSKALANKHIHFRPDHKHGNLSPSPETHFQPDRKHGNQSPVPETHFQLDRKQGNTSPIPETITQPPLVVDKDSSLTHGWQMGSMGKWFHHKELDHAWIQYHKDSSHGLFHQKDSGHGWFHKKDSGHGWFHHKDSGHGWFYHRESNNGPIKKKDRARAENAHMHAAVSVAGLASALAAITAEQNANAGSKMSQAVASAAELLASQFIEIAEHTASHDHVASVVRSAVDIRSAGDLMTLTAAAATALRGEAALRARLPKEASRNSAISPCDRSITEAHYMDPFHTRIKDHHPLCVGELQLYTEKGELQRKHARVYINKKSQVMIKMKSKHVPGAFSKDKRQVYGVNDHIATFSFTNKEGNQEETYFGLETAHGYIKFKCDSKSHKQQWVDGIQNLFYQVGSLQSVEHSVKHLNVKG